ncbi:hypothetical protein [Nocardia seriolae]|uniref:hypothetical protein n=1 Tax=Nocardia seriolae TaxID=37332 RepID=UPI0004BB3FC8|nr:hypothetical protein [Nocardia seriolae]MTJ61100.1 hypothetical protein [Nocardia seriolae]MTJ76584.1 hypothetical protein [Nocardia seriolae]MTJ90770.1 hypothetical protein [Nocardia seriolae]MTK34729.1 hypothetical protein [Nocardia seriolae]MTK39079.1 hypothetical protein [Nocardia seriolae]
MDAAVFGFAGVIVGAITSSAGTIFKEIATTRRELAQRDRIHERERRTAHDVFQRDSIVALQSAISDLIAAAYAELDRMITEYGRTETWPARRWETPTAVGWSETILRLESSRARVFDDDLRSLADRIRISAGDAVWATNLEEAKAAGEPLEPLNRSFNDRVGTVLPPLF